MRGDICIYIYIPVGFFSVCVCGGGWGELQSILSPVARRLLFFIATVFLRLLVFKATTELGRGKCEWEV